MAALWRVHLCSATLLREISMSAQIVSDPDIMIGKPVVEGTRLTVEMILEKLAAGETIEELCSAHPRLEPDGVRAALRYAAEVLRNDVVYPLAANL